jgi:hypothetical protein
MKWFLKTSVLAFAAGLWVSPFSARADLEVSADVRIGSVADFDAPLDQYGDWVVAGSFGRCWHPTHIEAGWRPYCDGHWEWTDCGWYWATGEPWGWACYHYGRWALDANFGWIWVPGIEWAPAWVSWRFGGGYCGWAPLPPPTIVLAPTFFVFVEERHFRDHHHRNTVIVNNTTIINRTRVINNIRHETRNIAGAGRRRVVVNEGPGAAAIERATRERISPRPIREAVRDTPVPERVRRRAATETRTAPAQPGTTQPGAGRPETRTPPTESRRESPEARTVPQGAPPRESRNIPVPPTHPSPEARQPAPETRALPPQARTAPPPPFRGAPGERSPVRGRVEPHVSRPPVMSPRETERRVDGGRRMRRSPE